MVARKERCPLCGGEFDAEGQGCRPSCPLAKGCRVVCCPGCGYTYDEQVGDAREGFPAGTPWAAVPDSWCCPDCGVREKVDFVPAADPASTVAG